MFIYKAIIYSRLMNENRLERIDFSCNYVQDPCFLLLFLLVFV